MYVGSLLFNVIKVSRRLFRDFYSNRLPSDYVDMWGTTLIRAAANSLHSFLHIKIGIVLYVSNLRCTVSPPCLFVGPNSKQLLECAKFSEKDAVVINLNGRYTVRFPNSVST
jgi:hypothetical protein